MTDDSKVHSFIGASGYYRWKACPGSVRLCKTVPNPSSVYAAEGTVAHGVADDCMDKGVPVRDPAAFLGQKRKADGFEFVVDQQMVDAVKDYLASITRDIAPGDDTAHEVGFDLSTLHPGLFGTSDHVIHKPVAKKLIVRDFKYGAGVLVDAEDNEQLMYYALGALMKSGHPADTVELVINQPRCDHPDGTERRWAFNTLELLDFAAQLVEDAKATEAPDAPLHDGAHCKFCPAAGGHCPQLLSKAQVAAKQAFAVAIPQQYDPARLAEALKMRPAVQAWLSALDEFAYQEAMRGRAPPGFKLVEKRATRKWRDENEARQFLEVYGMDEKDIFEPQAIRSPAQIEKVLGKKTFAADVGPYVIKESSGYTLVEESDKRPAIAMDAKSAFTAIEHTTEG